MTNAATFQMSGDGPIMQTCDRVRACSSVYCRIQSCTGGAGSGERRVCKIAAYRSDEGSVSGERTRTSAARTPNTAFRMEARGSSGILVDFVPASRTIFSLCARFPPCGCSMYSGFRVFSLGPRKWDSVEKAMPWLLQNVPDGQYEGMIVYGL